MYLTHSMLSHSTAVMLNIRGCSNLLSLQGVCCVGQLFCARLLERVFVTGAAVVHYIIQYGTPRSCPLGYHRCRTLPLLRHSGTPEPGNDSNTLSLWRA